MRNHEHWERPEKEDQFRRSEPSTQRAHNAGRVLSLLPAGLDNDLRNRLGPSVIVARSFDLQALRTSLRTDEFHSVVLDPTVMSSSFLRGAMEVLAPSPLNVVLWMPYNAAYMSLILDDSMRGVELLFRDYG